MKRLFVALLITLLAGTSPLAAADNNSSNLWQIDVLVFQINMPNLIGNELLNLSTANFPPAPINTAITVGNAPVNDPLAKAAALMAQDSQYTILAHKYWLQDGTPRATTRPVRINSNPGTASGAPALDGTVKFYADRYLHLTVDLALQGSGQGGASANPAAAPVYRIYEQRRVDAKRTNYFDNPMFGALIYVAPVKPQP